MLLVFGIIFLIFAIGLIAIIYYLQKEDDSSLPIAFIGALCFGFIISGIFVINEYFNPSITPMDVYRGKTTLEITYRDSIAIDSVVVLKEEVK
jgi:Kef-type K+ transport system membrane component KefB